MVSLSHHASSKEIIKSVKAARSELSNVKFTEIANPDLQHKLLEYEEQLIVSRYKIGVLYAKEGQTEESQWFSNTDMSPQFEEFLHFLGERVQLEGFTGYRGGLDVKGNTTGTHSVYTKFEDFEIMFHGNILSQSHAVSTLLPFQENDEQRVERKRHLGNDVVIIIFKEGNEPIDPSIIKSQFNHIFVVVKVDDSILTKYSSNTNYIISIANKAGVDCYGPFIPYPPVFEKNEEFRDFLLTKLINSERIAMGAPDFRGKLIRTSGDLLNEIAKEWLPKAKEGKSRSFILSSSSEETPIQKSPPKKHPEVKRDLQRPTTNTTKQLPKHDEGFIILRQASDVCFDEKSSKEEKVDETETAMTPLTVKDSRTPETSPSSSFILSIEDFNQLEKEYEEMCQGRKGVRMESFIVDPRVSPNDLTKIWFLRVCMSLTFRSIADQNQDKKLNFEEFVLYKVLIKAHLAGETIPTKLTDDLLALFNVAKGRTKWRREKKPAVTVLFTFQSKEGKEEEAKITLKEFISQNAVPREMRLNLSREKSNLQRLVLYCTFRSEGAFHQFRSSLEGFKKLGAIIETPPSVTELELI